MTVLCNCVILSDNFVMIRNFKNQFVVRSLAKNFFVLTHSKLKECFLEIRSFLTNCYFHFNISAFLKHFLAYPPMLMLEHSEQHTVLGESFCLFPVKLCNLIFF